MFLKSYRNNFNFYLLTVFFTFLNSVYNKHTYFDDICGHINNQRIYLEYGESGILTAKYSDNNFEKIMGNVTERNQKCSVEFVTCPSCIIKVNFKFMNTSRNCGKSTVYDSCGCDYVWIYEPSFERVSGEQYCGRFITNNISNLNYVSQSRRVAITFLYNKNYGHAFTLEYFSERNKINFTGYPRFNNINNSSQFITSPFFPNYYPTDLSMEHSINCDSLEKCKISLIFTDFQIDDSTIIEFFDWNGQRLYVTSGNIFRPPVITTSGPSLVVKFYANGGSNLGFKASYFFLLGDLDDAQYKPNIDCGGPVNNLGGGITMMNMVREGTQLFDCVWLIQPPAVYFHMKTHLYIKVITFLNFAGNAEIVIRQGLTSNGPLVDNLKQPPMQYYSNKQKEHVVPISQGFYVSLRGLFRPESQFIIVYAAFNYKDCFAGTDFLCHNLRCISTLLNCDGFDHCGDNSDEITDTCSKDYHDRRQWSKTPNFLFPKVEGYSDLTTATLIFLLCSFGLIGLIFALAILLYRINLRTRHQRQIQNHIETIHAILEEGVGEIEEEIIIADDPPDYEPPPEYDEVVKLATDAKLANKNVIIFNRTRRCSRCHPHHRLTSTKPDNNCQGTSRSCQTTPTVPDYPPPDYTDELSTNKTDDENNAGPSSLLNRTNSFDANIGLKLRKNLKTKANIFMKMARKLTHYDEAKYFSDTELFTLNMIDGDIVEEVADGLTRSISLCGENFSNI